MNARDELAKVIHGAPARVAWNGEQQVIADAILAAGYRKPRTITTTEELDALPNGVVVFSRGRTVWEKTAGDWYMVGDDAAFITQAVKLPATVLHEGYAA